MSKTLEQRLEEATAKGPTDLTTFLQGLVTAPPEDACLTERRPVIDEHLATATLKEL